MRYFLAALFLSLSLSVSAPIAHAETTGTLDSELSTTKTGLKGAASLFKNTGTKAGFPEGAVQPEVAVGQLIKALIMLMGVIFGVLVVYAGFLWLTARGDDTQVKKSKSILESAVIGIVIVVAAYAITSFVVDRVISAGLQSGTANPASSTAPSTPGADVDLCENVTCTGGETCAAGICSGG